MKEETRAKIRKRKEMEEQEKATREVQERYKAKRSTEGFQGNKPEPLQRGSVTKKQILLFFEGRDAEAKIANLVEKKDSLEKKINRLIKQQDRELGLLNAIISACELLKKAYPGIEIVQSPKPVTDFEVADEESEEDLENLITSLSLNESLDSGCDEQQDKQQKK